MNKVNENNKLLKALIIIISYFIYDIIINQFLYFFNINDVVKDLIADTIYFLFIMIVYWNKIKTSYISFIHDHHLKKTLFFIWKWVLILYGITFIGGVLTQMFFPNLGLDDNTQAIYSLYEVSTYYTIFKIVLFSTVVESLIYLENVRNIISNRILFVIFSSLFYGLMNIAYADLSLVSLIDFIQSFFIAIVLSIIYLKNNDNIVAVMLVKLVYNLIPLTFLILSVFNIN